MHQYSPDFPAAEWRRCTAFHEAGHAVIAIGVGVPFKAVSVRGKRGASVDLEHRTYRCSGWQSRWLANLAKAAAGGPLAEVKYLRDKGFSADYALAWSDDDISIYSLAPSLPNDMHPLCAPYDDRVRFVEATLDRDWVWDAVQRLAHSIDELGQLSFDDAKGCSGMTWKCLLRRQK